MLGQTLGEHRIVSELGSGGMGSVYLAEGAGGPVAIKVVHPHLLEVPGVLDRFMREAEAGKQVRNPNVVRTLSVSEGSGTHYLVMEYVEGQTLRELLVEMETVPESLCRHIGTEIAKALAGIHAAGIIHRDLKPDNVLITRDHVVKVMDLGLARLQTEAARLSQAGQFAGSVLYASPEQFTTGGDDLDGRADLYALGLLLYELGTGRHPFAGDDVAAVMHSQLNEEPPRPGELNPQLSPFAEELVLQLLAKDPGERFASAEEVAAILTQGEDSRWWQQRSGEIREAQPLRRIRIPRETALYGRDPLLATLRGHYEESGVVLLQGEAGVGKTRLVDEMAARLRGDGNDFHFLFGSYPPGGTASASGAFVQAYEEIRPRLGELLPDTPLVPALAALLEGSSPPAGVEPLSRDGTEVAIARVTHALARDKPTIVLIDDLHFAPEEGRALFASLAARVAGHRVLLVGTMRPGLPAEWLGELERLPHVTLHEVHRLGPKDLHDLLMDALKSRKLAEALGGQIAWKSDGNPFFVFEILQGLRDDGLLVSENGRLVQTAVIKDLTVPSSLRDLILGRISALEEEDKNILEMAACAGYEFDPSLVGEALGIERIPLLRRLGRLEKKQRLVHAMGRRFRFDHHQVCEALYEGLSELLREDYHALLGEALEKRQGDEVEICAHFLRGGRGDRAKPHLLPVLELLEQRNVNTLAIELAERALAIEGLLDGEEVAAVLEKKAGRLNVLGHYEDSIATIRSALPHASCEQQLVLSFPLGNVLVNMGRYAEAEEVCRDARALAYREEHGEGIAGAGVVLGNALMYQGRFEEAAAAYREARDLENKPPGAMSIAGPTGNLGWVLGCAGRYREALDLSDIAIDVTEDEPWGRVINLGYRIAYFRDLGDYARSEAEAQRTLELARDMGYRWGEATSLQEWGATHEEMGRRDEAEEQYRRALEIRRGIEEPFGIAETLISLGRLGEDRDALEEACAIGERIHAPTPQVLAAAYLGETLPDLMSRVRRRQAIEAAFVLGDTQTARSLLEALDVPDKATLLGVPLYRRLLGE